MHIDDAHPTGILDRRLADCAYGLVALAPTPGPVALPGQEAASADVTHRHTATLGRTPDGPASAACYQSGESSPAGLCVNLESCVRSGRIL
jgi:hypothetical protein